MPPADARRYEDPDGISGRSVVLLALVACAAWSVITLGFGPDSLLPTPGGLALAGRFLAAALAPALTYEAAPPAGTAPLLLKGLAAAWTTVVFAAMSMTLAVVAAAVLAFGASTAWWSHESGTDARSMWRRLRPAVYAGSRALIAGLRSVHELLWALLLLAAFGISPLTAVVAIALPYAGVLAKVWSELIDEAPRDAAQAMRDAGAAPITVFFFGLLPRALPDITAYALYRFECALRSSAVLGFFGFPTLGYFIAASFENLHVREMWTYLYVLFALVAAVDWWSGAVRRRLVG